MMAAGIQSEDPSQPFCISKHLYGCQGGPDVSPVILVEDLHRPAETFRTLPADGFRVHDDREALVDSDDGEDGIPREPHLPRPSGRPTTAPGAAGTDLSPYHCHVPLKHASKKARNQLIAVVVLSTVFMTAEIIGGLLSNSLALVADATHLASDITGFLISLIAVWLAKKKPSIRLTFGYYRTEVIGALLSILIIWVVTAVLVYLAIMRIKNNDYEVYANEMLITASVGVVFNIIMGLTLHSGLCKRCNVESKFGHGHSHGGHGHSHGDSGHSHGGNGHSHGDDDHGVYDDIPGGSGSDQARVPEHEYEIHNHTEQNIVQRAHHRIQEMGHPGDSGYRQMGEFHGGRPIMNRNDFTNDSHTQCTSNGHSTLNLQENGRSPTDLSEIEITDNTAGRRNNDYNILHVDNVVIETATDQTRTNSSGLLDKLTGDPDANINIKAAMVHVLGDLLQSIGVLIAAGIVKSDPSRKIADPICTFIFSLIVLVTTFTVLRDIMLILLEAVPRSSDFSTIAKDLQELEGVRTAHNIHVWALTLDKVVVAVHLAADPAADFARIVESGTIMLQKKHSVFHSTIQVEPYVSDTMASCHQCSSPGSIVPRFRGSLGDTGNVV